MMKRTAAALALLLMVGCASSSMTSNETTGSTGTTAKSSGGYARDFIALSTPGDVRMWDLGSGASVGGFYVRGNKTRHGFIPVGEVQGKGNFCADGRDWLSLTDLRVYTADKTPVAPYVLGCVSGNGFRPASREIVTQ